MRGLFVQVGLAVCAVALSGTCHNNRLGTSEG